MSSESRSKIQRIFGDALEVQPEERAAFLRRECGDDQLTLEAVQGLLRAAADAPTDFLRPFSADPEWKSLTGRQLGSFTIGDEIGRGNMGVVYRAKQSSLDRDVAIKVLMEGPGTSTIQMERFHREAKSAARLSHGGIVSVLDHGQDGALHWFAMDLVVGRDLESELKLQRVTGNGENDPILPLQGSPTRIRESARIVAEVAEALAHAHEHQVVHRDVKPSNILLTTEGIARLADFGIARDESLGTLTQPDAVMGSLPYMSPEQARILQHPVDPRTDIYSAGVVLYELLGARRPFGGESSLEILSEIRTAVPPPLRTLGCDGHRDLQTVCFKAMHRRPERRYQTARAFAKDLRRFLAYRAIDAKPPSLGDKALSWIRHHRVPVAVTVLLLSAVALTWIGSQSVIRAGSIRDDVDRVAKLIDDGPNLLSDSELTALRSDLQRLALTKGTTEAQSQTIADCREILSIYDEGLRREALNTIRNPEIEAADGIGRVAIDDLVKSVGLTQRSGGDPKQTIAQAIQPWINVSVTDANAQPVQGIVSIRYIDETTGEPGPPETLGPLPLRDAPVKATFARVVVDVGSQGYREFTRNLREGDRVDLTTRLLPDETRRSYADEESMARIEGGRFDTYNPHVAADGIINGWTIQPFLLDHYEVRVGEYREFLATRANPSDYVPKGWPEDWRTGISAQKPVGGIPIAHAHEYAEWRGKRLPTFGELAWAARGAEGRLYPWADDTWRIPDLVKPAEPGATAWATYLLNASDVTSRPDLATPDGVHWLFGNVWELTETPGRMAFVRGKYLFEFETRTATGASWLHASPPDKGEKRPDLTLHQLQVPGFAYARPDLGFRCARSIIP